MAIFRHFVPRSVRRVAHPVGYAKRRATPKAVRKVMYVRHPVGYATSAATLAAIGSRRKSKTSRATGERTPDLPSGPWYVDVLRHGTDGHYYFTHEGCITHHQRQDVAVRCAKRIPALYQDKPVAPAPVAPSVPPVRVTQNSLRVAKATRKADRASRTRGMRRVLFGWKRQPWRSAVKAAKAEAGKTYSAKVFTTATGAVTWRCDHHHPTQLGAQRCAEEQKAARATLKAEAQLGTRRAAEAQAAETRSSALKMADGRWACDHSHRSLEEAQLCAAMDLSHPDRFLG